MDHNKPDGAHNHPDDPHTYYSRAWRTTSCPDIVIATDDVAKITLHHVDQLGESDHKPVILHTKQDFQPTNIKQCPSWNYKKANWTECQAKADQYCNDLDLVQQHLNNKVKLFTTAILTAATETIPRGRRRNYILLWNEQLQELHNAVSKLREIMEYCPTDENTQAHNKAKAKYTRQKRPQTRAAWYEKSSSLNSEKDTCKLWKLTKLLNEDNPEATNSPRIRRRATHPKESSQLLGKALTREK